MIPMGFNLGKYSFLQTFYLHTEPDCNPPIQKLTHVSVPTCAVPDGATLTSSHVTASAPGAGNRFPQEDNVTLTCDSGWMYPNGDLSRSFTCTGMDTLIPAWTYCTGLYCYYYYSKVLKYFPR